MKLKLIVFGFILVFSSILAGCNTQQQSAATSDKKETNQQEKENHLKIYTTIYPLEDFAKKIGGEYVDVESIIPPGSDAHTFEPTTKQMTNIAEADAFIYSGLGLEAFAEKMSTALENENVQIVEATHGIENRNHEEDAHQHEEGTEHSEADDHGHVEEHSETDEHGHVDEHSETDEHGHDAEQAESKNEENDAESDDHGHNHGDLDPHVWLDPYRAILLAENIKNTLIELKPDAKNDFETNFQSLKTELEKLDEEFHHLVESKENPEIIVSHAAYGYWEESYGIHQIAVAGLDPSDEPSQKELANIIDMANEKEIKYILFEQNITPKIAEIIRKEIKAEPLYLHNLSVVTEEDIQNGEDYFSLMRKNLETLEKALK